MEMTSVGASVWRNVAMKGCVHVFVMVGLKYGGGGGKGFGLDNL